MKSTRKQIEKYEHLYGTGALVYSLGFCPKLQGQLGNAAMLLDAGSLVEAGVYKGYHPVENEVEQDARPLRRDKAR